MCGKRLYSSRAAEGLSASAVNNLYVEYTGIIVY